VNERDGVRTVFFDAGYTLLCMDPPQETIFLAVCRELDIRIDTSRMPRAVEYANEMLRPSPASQDPRPFSQARVDAHWTEYHRRVIEGCSPDADAQRLAPLVYRGFARRIGWRVYDDVVGILDHLHERGISAGVISNWTGDLEDVLGVVGLNERFDVVIDSARFGHEKPHAPIFSEALRRAGIEARHAVHVGDSVEADVGGALASGLRAVLLDRHDRHRDFDLAPRVSSLMQITALL
jgi:putative hydrolase of the HAD superfamily